MPANEWKAIIGLEIHAELDGLNAAGAFKQVSSLYGAFANPHADLSAETLDSYLHEIGTEWEAELDEMAGRHGN